MEFINLKEQYRAYKEEICLEINKVLDTSTYIMGPAVSHLEVDLSRFCGVEHAIACSSGTDALVLALMAAGVKPGDEVITTTFSFIATAEAIALLGAKPVFVDIDEQTYNIDVLRIADAITDKTRCIMPVSLFGQMCNLAEINKVAKRFSKKIGTRIYVIEDAAQSFGANYGVENYKSCASSDIACTSFFPAKPLGCYGDGGAVFTNDAHIAKMIRELLNHGQKEKYIHSSIGINGRLDSIQAAVLRVKLKYYSEEIAKRNTIARRYSIQLKDCIVPYTVPSSVSVWAQYCVRVKNRDRVQLLCRDAGVPTAIYYPVPLHLQPVFECLGYKKGDMPVSERVAADILALPMSAFLKEVEQNNVINVINDAIKNTCGQFFEAALDG